MGGNPGVKDPDFSMQSDLLSTARGELDVVSRGNSDAPPLAADGGPPKPDQGPDWTVEQPNGS